MLCECGCGRTTKLARCSDSSKGWIRGVPLRFAKGHNLRRLNPQAYKSEDRGYSTPCWIWQRGTDEGGYGKVGIVGVQTTLAHRFFYMWVKGDIPDDLELDHLCRVRNCVNPDHLEAVTHQENDRRGMVTKLNPDAVRQIRAMRSEGKTRAQAAAPFGIHPVYVTQITTRKMWADVE